MGSPMPSSRPPLFFAVNCAVRALGALPLSHTHKKDLMWAAMNGDASRVLKVMNKHPALQDEKIKVEVLCTVVRKYAAISSFNQLSEEKKDPRFLEDVFGRKGCPLEMEEVFRQACQQLISHGALPQGIGQFDIINVASSTTRLNDVIDQIIALHLHPQTVKALIWEALEQFKNHKEQTVNQRDILNGEQAFAVVRDYIATFDWNTSASSYDNKRYWMKAVEVLPDCFVEDLLELNPQWLDHEQMLPCLAKRRDISHELFDFLLQEDHLTLQDLFKATPDARGLGKMHNKHQSFCGVSFHSMDGYAQSLGAYLLHQETLAQNRRIAHSVGGTTHSVPPAPSKRKM